MASPNAGVLDTVLNTFRTQIDGGFGVLQGPVHGTLGTLIVISVVLMALFWALDESGSIFSPIIRKALVVGWWSYLILNWQTAALAVFTAFGNLGAQVGNTGGLAGFLNQPSKVVALGLQNAKSLLDLAQYYMGVQTTSWGAPPASNTGLNVGAALQALGANAVLAIEAVCGALLIVVAYFWLALEIVVTTIEFHIVILLGFCVLPFGVFERTASYAERVLSYVISAGFKVMALGIVIGLSQTFLTSLAITEMAGSLPGLDQIGGLALGILVVLMLAISAPKYAAAVISGHASTGMGNLAGAAGLAVGTGLAVAGTAKAAVAGAQGGARMASKAADAFTRRGSQGGSSPRGPAGPSGSSPSSPAGGLAAPAGSVADLAATVAPASASPGGSSAASAPAPTEGLAETITAANNNTESKSAASPGSASAPAGASPSAASAKGATASESAAAARQQIAELASTIHSAAQDHDGGAEPPPSTGRSA